MADDNHVKSAVDRSGAPLVEMRDISIAFGGIKAVDRASIDLYPGEVVGLLGHNGAGKSTLIKVLSGAYKRDAGTIFIDGKEVDIDNPRDAKALGIETIYQTLALADNVDAAANLYLGRELQHALGHARRHRHGSRVPQGDGPAQPQFPPLQGAGEVAVGRPAPVGRDRPRHPLQRPHPDHGRADRRARPAGDRAGRRADQAAQGAGHRHLPHQPRHPRRLRPRRPGRGDEERQGRRHRRRRGRHQGRSPRHDHPRQGARPAPSPAPARWSKPRRLPRRQPPSRPSLRKTAGSSARQCRPRCSGLARGRHRSPSGSGCHRTGGRCRPRRRPR